MKGKGKTAIDKECPLQFPDLEPINHERDCPRYTAILSRTEEDSIGPEELDAIQADLETLLASAGLRLKQLENEKQILVNWADKKDIKSLKFGKPETPSSGKRGGKFGDEKPNKKFKGQGGESSGKGAHQTPPGPGRPKSKIAQTKIQELDFSVDSPVELPKLPKNDAVNRFWTSVEPYCAEITNEDIKVLEDLLSSHEDDSDYFKVPSLGKHYSEKWAEEDLLEEQRDGAKINDKRRSANNNNSISNSNDATTLLKKAEQNNMEESPFGPLTQRLVSALIEENIMTPMDDTMAEITGGKESMDEAPAISPRALAKQLNIGNPAHLEKRIRRELEEQGILESDDKVEENPDDEILTELRQKQQELKSLTQYNISAVKNLMERAKEEMKKQDLKKKLAAADAEVLEAYRKIQMAKQKKKTPTKKERETAWKCLKDRETLVKTLEGKLK